MADVSLLGAVGFHDGGRSWPSTSVLFACLALPILLLALRDRSPVRRMLRPPAMELDGGLVVITGAAGGIGTQLALAFLRQGATVELWDVRWTALEEAVAWLSQQAGVHAADMRPRRVDVPVGWRALVAATVAA